MPEHDASHLESLLLNATRPVSEVGYDGWLLRFSRNDAKRASSVIAQGTSALPLETKIERCERAYEGRGLRTVFRLTSMTEPGLDEALETRGYVRFEPSLVQGCVINETASVPIEDVNWTWMKPEEWWKECGRLHEHNAEETFVRQTRTRLTRLATLGLVAYAGGATVACGQALVDGEYAGLFEIYTAEAQRGRGIGLAVSSMLLQEARRQFVASKAWLSVLADNGPALAVYEKLGFETVYEYWYRVRA